jgi:cob(I)alamin adenosyltransferase
LGKNKVAPENNRNTRFVSHRNRLFQTRKQQGEFYRKILIMKIYTKTGDKGDTSLIGGQRVSKTHERLEAYGSVDELNAWIGLIACQDIEDKSKTLLYHIQSRLLVIGSHLACPTPEIAITLPQLDIREISLLEQAIDDIDAKLPKLNNFILPGGTTVSSYCHIARTVCRRAERNILRISDFKPEEPVLIFINRLSDYLFVLARGVS